MVMKFAVVYGAQRYSPLVWRFEAHAALASSKEMVRVSCVIQTGRQPADHAWQGFKSGQMVLVHPFSYPTIMFRNVLLDSGFGHGAFF